MNTRRRSRMMMMLTAMVRPLNIEYLRKYYSGARGRSFLEQVREGFKNPSHGKCP